jgi:hypothetical protein
MQGGQLSADKCTKYGFVHRVPKPILLIYIQDKCTLYYIYLFISCVYDPLYANLMLILLSGQIYEFFIDSYYYFLHQRPTQLSSGI